MSDKFRLCLGLLLLLGLMIAQGPIFNWISLLWGDLWALALANLLAIDGVVIVIGALLLGIED